MSAIAERGGANTGPANLFPGPVFNSCKAEFLQPTSLQDTIIVAGSATEHRVFPVLSYPVANVRNAAGFAIDASIILVRNGAEIVLSTQSNIADAAITGLTLSFGSSTPVVLRENEQIVLRVAKHGGEGDVTSGVTVLCTWAVLNNYDTLRGNIDLDDTIKTVLTVPDGAFCDLSSFNTHGSCIVYNCDDVEHLVNVFLNVGGSDQLIEVLDVAAGETLESTMLLGNFSIMGLGGGWSVKAQLQVAVHAHAPVCQIFGQRRDSHD